MITEIIDSKRGLGKCLKKNNQEISPLSEEISIPSLHDSSCVFLKVVTKLNMWCLVVISLGYVRRGEISMIGETSGQLALSAGTVENALGNPKGPTEITENVFGVSVAVRQICAEDRSYCPSLGTVISPREQSERPAKQLFPPWPQPGVLI